MSKNKEHVFYVFMSLCLKKQDMSFMSLCLKTKNMSFMSLCLKTKTCLYVKAFMRVFLSERG